MASTPKEDCKGHLCFSLRVHTCWWYVGFVNNASGDVANGCFCNSQAYDIWYHEISIAVLHSLKFGRIDFPNSAECSCEPAAAFLESSWEIGLTLKGGCIDGKLQNTPVRAKSPLKSPPQNYMHCHPKEWYMTHQSLFPIRLGRCGQ